MPSSWDVINTAIPASLFNDDKEIKYPAEYSYDALHAKSASVPGGKLSIDGFFGIGVRQLILCSHVFFDVFILLTHPHHDHRHNHLKNQLLTGEHHRYFIPNPAKMWALSGDPPTSSGLPSSTPSEDGTRRAAPTRSTYPLASR